MLQEGLLGYVGLSGEFLEDLSKELLEGLKEWAGLEGELQGGGRM